LLLVFLMMAILTGVRWNLSKVLICISFMARDGNHLYELGVQSADVSALPGALPQSSMSLDSQQSPWFRELRRSAAVSQMPSWISPKFSNQKQN
jgi:hypothetical protein